MLGVYYILLLVLILTSVILTSVEWFSTPDPCNVASLKRYKLWLAICLLVSLVSAIVVSIVWFTNWSQYILVGAGVAMLGCTAALLWAGRTCTSNKLLPIFNVVASVSIIALAFATQIPLMKAASARKNANLQSKQDVNTQRRFPFSHRYTNV